MDDFHLPLNRTYVSRDEKLLISPFAYQVENISDSDCDNESDTLLQHLRATGEFTGTWSLSLIVLGVPRRECPVSPDLTSWLMTFPPLLEGVTRPHRTLNQRELRNYLTIIKMMNKHHNYLTMMIFLPHHRRMILSTKRIFIPKSNESVVLPKRSPI
jgi:hypothetical protein